MEERRFFEKSLNELKMRLLRKKGIGLQSVIVMMMMMMGRKKSLLFYIGLALALAEISLVAASYYEEMGLAAGSPYSVIPLHSPIVHTPTYLGSYPFILGWGNVLENRSAYSYVWINASALEVGDSFVVLPALNVGLIVRGGIYENNFTLRVVYTGSPYGSAPYWLNFTVFIPELGDQEEGSYSQIGFTTFSRSGSPLLGFKGAEFFEQISNVVGEDGSEFEYFFYIGNSSTPAPELTHGLVR